MADPFEELREKAIAKAKNEIKEAYASEEFALIQSINAYNETAKSYNLAYERLSEWYGIYYPEIRISSPQAFIGLAMLMADNQNLTKEQIVSVLKDEKKAESVLARIGTSMGRKLDGSERTSLSGFAEMAYRMQSAMEVMESYIHAASKRLLPNTSYLTDEMIAAELLSKAGSMERLALMPSSTIQLLGAEKALFKHIKYGSKPPKYGILFKLPVITAARKAMKGKMARMYAAKLTIALKADYFTKNFIAKELKESLDKSIERMKASTPDKPERKEFRRNDKFERPRFNKYSKYDNKRGPRDNRGDRGNRSGGGERGKWSGPKRGSDQHGGDQRGRDKNRGFDKDRGRGSNRKYGGGQDHGGKGKWRGGPKRYPKRKFR